MNKTSTQRLDRGTRRRWSRQEKHNHIASWRSGGESRAAYCRESGLDYGSFLRWIAEEQAGAAPLFAPVRVIAHSGNSAGDFDEGRGVPRQTGGGLLPGCVELIAPNGWRVAVRMSLGEVLSEARQWLA